MDQNSRGNRIIPAPFRAFEISEVNIIPCIEKIPFNDVNLNTHLTRNIEIKIPIVPSPMDCILNIEMIKNVINIGSVPIIYLNMTRYELIEQYLNTLDDLYCDGYKIGLCIAPDIEIIKKSNNLIRRASVVALDTLHSRPYCHLEMLEYIKKHYQEVDVISGNITNIDDMRRVIECGADSIRIGMTSNSINDAAEIIGCGRKQGMALYECAGIANQYHVPIISDGGISKPKDIAKGIALGADCVMIGKMFAAISESEARTIIVGDKKYKQYIGMSRKDIIDEGMLVESSPKLIEEIGGFDNNIKEWIKILKIIIARSGQTCIEGLKLNSILEICY